MTAQPGSRHGKCHLCGEQKKLTYEHVPPRKAFNDRTVFVYQGDDVLGLGPEGVIESEGGEQKQRGFGKYTLCGSCNSTTGSWYAAHFIKWTYQGMRILLQSGGSSNLHHLHYILPARILKQIVTMFASVNSPEFMDRHPALRKYVLHREERHLPPKYGFYVFFTLSARHRYVGVSGKLNIRSGQSHIMSEFTFPPFGYVLTFDSDPPDDRLCDISHFSRCEYNEFRVVNLHIPVLPVHLAVPGDYRTEEEIMEDYRRNVAAEQPVDNSE